MDAIASRYLGLLSELLPTKTAVASEIALQKARLGLPKPTELYLSDIHGEYEAFSHILRCGCGALQKAIDEAFEETLPQSTKSELTTLICYPEEKIAHVLSDKTSTFTIKDARANSDENWQEDQWYERAISLLLVLVDSLSLTHAYEDIQDELSPEFCPLLDELLSQDFPCEIVDTLIETNTAADFIEALCKAIRHLLVGQLHMVGDVYDRGPAPDLIMEELCDYPHVDVQWGNHDIVWMGAALGQRGCIAHVVRNCARYGNLSILTDAYGINLMPLFSFAQQAYKNDPCVGYALKGNPDLSSEEKDLNVKVQKAMAILQFKVEGQLIDENPSFMLKERKLLHTINRETNTIMVDGVEYELTDPVFPTVDWNDPYRLTDEEEMVMASLEAAFKNCEKLQRHMQFFLDKGSLYKIENNTLMFHACVPLNPDGTLKEVNIFGKTYKGKALFDAVDRYVRDAFTATDPKSRKRGCDLLWYLWLGEGSPLFAKSKMATFEIYLIADKAARKEIKNSFYSLLENDEVLKNIFEDFDMDSKTARIVCGHTPVKVKDGEDPVKCNGKVIIIDGGMSSAYQSTTGIAGFTLVSDSEGIRLVSHQPFAGNETAIRKDKSIESSKRIIMSTDHMRSVAETDEGKRIEQYVFDLEKLLSVYETGNMPE